MAQYEHLKDEQEKVDVVSSLKLDDNVIVPQYVDDSDEKSKSRAKSKSKSKSSKKKSKKKKILSKDDNIPSKSQYRSFDPFPERDTKPTHTQSVHCVTKTAPFNQLESNGNIQAQTQNASNLLSLDPEQHANDLPPHHHHHEDASNLAFPHNPFDHLMPHKNDFGTPNMAWIGEDGLVHTPQGGVYAKTTEAVANFRRDLKYDGSWHRVRQRYICLILLLMFLTVTAVVILLIARKVTITDIGFHTDAQNGNIVWVLDKDCPQNYSDLSQGCNVTISPQLTVTIQNLNWVPATVNSWSIQHTFLCTSSLNCVAGGTDIGQDTKIDQVDLTDNEINKKDTGSVLLNDTSVYELPGCHTEPKPNATYCEYQLSCLKQDNPHHFLLQMKITASLSFALQAGSTVTSELVLGVNCTNGAATICKVNDAVKNNDKICQ